MKTTDVLMQDHRQIRRALDVLEQISVRVREGEKYDRDVQDITRFLQHFADRHHQGKEEGVLFPALLRDRGQKFYSQLCALILEHNRERSLVEGLEEAIQSRQTKDLVYFMARLKELLSAHVEEEERLLFPLADAALSPSEDEQVVHDMQNYERTWQENALPALLQRLDELESEYLGNRASHPSLGSSQDPIGPARPITKNSSNYSAGGV